MPSVLYKFPGPGHNLGRGIRLTYLRLPQWEHFALDVKISEIGAERDILVFAVKMAPTPMHVRTTMLTMQRNQECSFHEHFNN